MKRAALYVRVSTAEQRDHGLSVDSQISALQKYCEDNGYKIAGIYNDAGISARKSYKNRPALLQMLQDCQQKHVDICLFTKLDRFFRSVADYYACVEQMAGVPWRAIWEDYETETSAGVFKVNIMLSVAQSEADRTSERIKSVMDYKRARGEYVGTVPVGYKREGKTLAIDPETEAGVRALLEGYLDYLPLDECVKNAKEKGVTFHRRTANDVLKRPTYYGDAYGCKVPAYITKEQHDAIMQRMNENIRKPIRTGVTFTFQGMCRCGYCGRRMSSTSRRRHSGKRGDYIQIIYQCPKHVNDFIHPICKGCGINEEFLEDAILKELESAVSEYNYSLSKSSITTALVAYNKDKKKLEDKKKRLAELYEDDMITKEEYQQRRDALRDKERDLKAPEAARKVILPAGWKETYFLLDKENRRLFWRRTVKEILVYQDHKVKIIL